MSDEEYEHSPSKYRRIKRRIKNGIPPDELIAEARGIRDEYYSSLAHIRLATRTKKEGTRSSELIREGILKAQTVRKLWRRAELLTKLAKIGHGARSRVEGEEVAELILTGVTNSVLSIPGGKELSRALSGCSPYLHARDLVALLPKAVTNSGSTMEDGRTVLRHWGRNSEGKADIRPMILPLEAVVNPLNRGKLLAYLDVQCKKGGIEHDEGLLGRALAASLQCQDENRYELLRYLARHYSSREELERIAGVLPETEVTTRARVLATLAGAADKEGMRNTAADLLRRGLRASAEIPDPRSRASVRKNLAKGLALCGEERRAKEVFKSALKDTPLNDPMRKKIIRMMGECGLRTPGPALGAVVPRGGGEAGVKGKAEAGDGTGPGREKIARKRNQTSRDILALFNTYEGRLGTPHLRAVARAAPLCHAYGLGLALIDFPGTGDELIKRVVRETNIGDEGQHLARMSRDGEILMLKWDVTKGLFSPTGKTGEAAVPGSLIATTPRPLNGKGTDMKRCVELARKEHPEGRAMVVAGLGKKGLPSSLLNFADHHVEVTGRKVSLETCAALGIIAYQLMEARAELGGFGGEPANTDRGNLLEESAPCWKGQRKE